VADEIIDPDAIKEEKEVPLTAELSDGSRPVIGKATVHTDGTITGTFNDTELGQKYGDAIRDFTGMYSLKPREKRIDLEQIPYKPFFENKNDIPDREPYIKRPLPKLPPAPIFLTEEFRSKFDCMCPWNNGYDPSAPPRHNLRCPALMGDHEVGDRCGPKGHTNFESDKEG